jgi:hypothetical protein
MNNRVGVFDPTLFTDVTNTLLYLVRGKYTHAAITFAGVIPSMGDTAKMAKWATVAATAGLGARTAYKEVKNYSAFGALRRKHPRHLVELWHFTSIEGAKGIRDTGQIVVNGGAWRWGHKAKDDVYFGASPRNWFVRTFVWGLPPYKQQEVFRVLVPIREVAWRLFGIRVVRGPVPVR